MEKKLKIGLIFGGKSAEHEVSIMSAKNIYGGLKLNRYKIILIGIDKKGCWRLVSKDCFQNIIKGLKKISDFENKKIAAIPQSNGEFMLLDNKKEIIKIDIAFPILHGPFGEDGTAQGMFKIIDVPFVGPDVLGAAIGMDKVLMKRILKEQKIPIADFLYFTKNQKREINYNKIADCLRLPFFVKPANLGSSVGISKVNNQNEFQNAIDDAFKYDKKIIIEECVVGREIECSVLGNEEPKASIPGEVKLNDEFYSYETKYISEDGAKTEIPAKLPADTIEEIKKMAVKTFKALDCEGMGRVDFFLTKQNQIIVNEINTIPGFTAISMYPKLWEASGMPFKKLISELVELALQRFDRDKKLKTSYTK
ncbi:D-alanine--D-alanine ligase [Candidatus Parcubacteria bacterium]|nr:D-alanine--D-alanine ligase [Candidatus Parcubacteria bacterium]